MNAANPKILKTVTDTIIAVIVFCIAAGSAAANPKVVLLTGEVMTVDRADVKDGRVWISWNGLELSIAEKDVLRIERDGKTQVIVDDASFTSRPEPSPPERQNPVHPEIDSKRKSRTNSRPAKRSAPNRAAGKSGPGQNPGSSEPLALTAAAEKLLAFLSPDGFGDIGWGDHRDPQTGLKRLYQKSELPDVIEYVRPTDSLQLGSDAQNAIIKYAFWKNRLYMVTLWASGPEAYQSIRSAMEGKYGRGVPKPGSQQTYYWIDDEADRMIEYFEDKGLALLWMRSREINNQYKLARLRIPIRAGQNSSAGAAK